MSGVITYGCGHQSFSVHAGGHYTKDKVARVCRDCKRADRILKLLPDESSRDIARASFMAWRSTVNTSQRRETLNVMLRDLDVSVLVELIGSPEKGVANRAAKVLKGRP